MDNAEFERFCAAVTDGLIASQMYAIPAFHVLRELVADMARLQPDGDRYLTGLYDRVFVKLDHDGSDGPEKVVVGQSRDMLAALFRDARASLRRYLRLAPNASDRNLVREHLERL